jgi:predicted PurR-regulated permease PerM
METPASSNPHEVENISPRGSASGRIIAAGIVVAFCYFASSVVVTLLVAVLLTYFLDPVVVLLEKLRIPRALGSLLIVLVVLTLLAALGWTLIERADSFGAEWPRYRAPLREAAGAVEKKMEGFEARVSEITPTEKHGVTVVEVASPHSVREAVVERLNSIYPGLFGISILPFLIFFMLAAKRQVWHSTMQLFPLNQRTNVKAALDDVSTTLRGYVVGTGFVAVFLVLVSWVFFWAMGLDFAFLVALVSGLMNLVPYLGAVIAWLPPLLIALTQFHTVGPFIFIAGVLFAFHLLAANVLFPAVIGRHVHLNAVAVTVALLFWGWMWGAIGLLLAIPITAAGKVVCDHVEEWRPVGRWLGAD